MVAATITLKTIGVPQTMFDPDLPFVALVLLISIAILLFPGGPGTRQRLRVPL